MLYYQPTKMQKALDNRDKRKELDELREKHGLNKTEEGAGGTD